MTSLDDLLKLMLDGRKPKEERKLNPTQREFIYSVEPYAAYMGPAGCAKTSSGAARILLRAVTQGGSQHLIARADYNDLLDTTMRTCENLLRELPPGTLVDRDKSPPAKWWIKDAYGGVSQITFMGLHEALGSYEFTSAFLDEANEIEEARVHEVGTRLRALGSHYSVALAFNPPPTTHWLYTACTGMNHEGQRVADPWMKLYKPQPRENVHNLRANYYEDMAAHLPEDMRQRLVDGNWGAVFPGRPVVPQFRKVMHASKRIPYTPGATLFRLWDFGFGRPCCLWAHVTTRGHLLVLKMLLGHNEEVRAFAKRVKLEQMKAFPQAYQYPVEDWGDPAVKQKKDTGQALAAMLEEGITVHFKHTPFDLSMQELRHGFEVLIEGEPAIQIDKDAEFLIQALQGGYHTKDDGLTPHKDGFYDHPVDCLRYGKWALASGLMAGSNVNKAADLPSSLAYDPSQDVT